MRKRLSRLIAMCAVPLLLGSSFILWAARKVGGQETG